MESSDSSDSRAIGPRLVVVGRRVAAPDGRQVPAAAAGQVEAQLGAGRVLVDAVAGQRHRLSAAGATRPRAVRRRR